MELSQLKKNEIEANRQFQQSHSYKQRNYLRKEPIFNERTEPIAALPPTILKLKAVPAAEAGKVLGGRYSVPPPQVTILNPAEEVTDTQASDNQSEAPSMARSRTQGFMKRNNEDIESQATRARDGTESNPGSPMMKTKWQKKGRQTTLLHHAGSLLSDIPA